MYHYCKLCGECLLLSHSVAPEFACYKCHLCPEYEAMFMNLDDCYECITYKNMRFIFFSHVHIQAELRGLGQLQRSEDGIFNRPEIIHSSTIKELTHELAVQWVKKLRTLITFQ